MGKKGLDTYFNEKVIGLVKGGKITQLWYKKLFSFGKADFGNKATEFSSFHLQFLRAPAALYGYTVSYTGPW